METTSFRVPGKPNTVLIALTGMSPAILSETVWGLAHLRDAIIPNEVVAVTTRPGRYILIEKLLANGAWDHMKELIGSEGHKVKAALQFGEAQSHIRLLPAADGSKDLDDIVSPESSAAAADHIMKTLREYTENPETRVIVSIAGGRKTLSALMMSCISLLGREQDQVCHVLVNEPYDNPRMNPTFLFPDPKSTHELDGKMYKACRAEIQLIDIPYVRMRGWYENTYNSLPASYSSLVERFGGIRPKAINYPVVRIDLPKGEFKIGGKQTSLNPVEFWFMAAILGLRKDNEQIASWSDVFDRMECLKESEDDFRGCQWYQECRNRNLDPAEDTRKIASRIRTKIKKQICDPDIPYALVPNLRADEIKLYPKAKIKYIRH